MCGVTHMVGMVGGGAWQVRNATDIVIFSGWLPSASTFDDLAFDIVAMVRTPLTARQGPEAIDLPTQSLVPAYGAPRRDLDW